MALSTLIVVDGPNLYNDAARYLAVRCPIAPGASTRRDYFLRWFDVDRLLNATLLSSGLHMELNAAAGLGTVILHSNKKLGSDTAGSTLSGHAEILDFWSRQGSANFTSTMLVDVSGAPQGKETGVDTSIVVHLFETMDSWQAAILFTNDADLVPAVWALRRRGKRIYCSSTASPSEDAARPLIQASQHFIRWNLGFLEADYLLWEFLRPNGNLDQFLDGPAAARMTHMSTGHGLLLLSDPSGETKNSNPQRVAIQGLLPKGFTFADVANPWTLALRIPGTAGYLAAAGIDRHLDIFSGARWPALWHPAS